MSFVERCPFFGGSLIGGLQRISLPLPLRLSINGFSFKKDFLMLMSSEDQSELDVLSTITL